jgi:hypothetical protein
LGITETTPTNGASSLSDLLLLRNEGTNASIIFISDSPGAPLIPPRPNPLLVAEAGSLQFLGDLVQNNGTNSTANITLLDDSSNSSDTIIVRLVTPIPPGYKTAIVTNNFGQATLTESEESAGIAIKCIIPNALWVNELDWGITETTVSNGVSSLSDLVLLRNEGSNAAVILISDAAGPLTPPRPNPLLVAENGLEQFQAELLILNGTNTTAIITVQDDSANSSDTLTVQVVPRIPTTFNYAVVSNNFGTATMSENDELAGVAIKCVIPNAQWVTELDWGITETTVSNGVSSLSDLLLLRNEGPNAAVILMSDVAGPLTPPRPNPLLVAENGLEQFQAELLILGGTNATAILTVQDDSATSSDTLTVQVVPRIPPTFNYAVVSNNFGTATISENDELAGVAIKCVIPNAQWVTELDWGLTETTVSNGVSSLSDLLLLRNEGPNAAVILISDGAGPLTPPRPNPLLVAENGLEQFQAELLILGGTNATAILTVQDDSAASSDTLTVQVVPRIPPTFNYAVVSNNFGIATITENDELAGVAIKCVIPNAQWVNELDWGLTETTVTNGVSSLSDLLLLRNEGPNAVVIFISDGGVGGLAPPRPNPLLVVETGLEQFQAELLILGGTNATAVITVQDDSATSSDTVTVQVVPRIPTTFNYAVVTNNFGSATITENDELAGVAIKCVIPNAQWVKELDWGITETTVTNGVSSLSDLLLLRNEGPNAVVIFISDGGTGTLIPPRPNPLLVVETGLEQFLGELLILGGTNTTAIITVQEDSFNSSDKVTVQVVPRIPPIFNYAVVTNNFGSASITENDELAGVAIKCVIPNAQWVNELDWGITETTPTNGVTSISDLLLLRNEGPNAAVILTSDSAGASLIASRPNLLLVPETGVEQFLAELLILNGTNATAIITVQDDSATSSDTLTVRVVPRIPTTYNYAVVTNNFGTATITESDELAGVAIKCVIPNAQWVNELDWGITETTPTNGVSSLSDLLLLRNEGPNAVLIFISDGAGPLTPPRPNALLVAESSRLQFAAELLVLNGTNATALITLLDDNANSSDTVTVQVVPRIPTIFNYAVVSNNFGTATITENDELAGVAIKCVIPNAQWAKEFDWGITETTPTNGASSLSDLLLLRNEGPNAAVIYISDGAGPLTPPRPNALLVAESSKLQFTAELLIFNGTNSTAIITVLDDSTNSSDTVTVQVVPRIPTIFKVADVPTNGTPGSVTLTESEEAAGNAIKCFIRNAQWVKETDWAVIESTNYLTTYSDLLLLRNEGPDAVVILISDCENCPAVTPPRPNPLLVGNAPTLQFQSELLILGGTNATASITLLDDSANSSDTLIVQVVPRIPPVFKVADVPTNGTPVAGMLTQTEEDAGIALKCIIRNAQWVNELDWAFLETTTFTNISDLLLLRNEGPDAAVIFYSDSENGRPLVPPRPNPLLVAETGTSQFLAELLILGGTNTTANITVQNDVDPSTGFSDILMVQVVPRIPPTYKPTDVPTDGTPITGTLTQSEEDAGTALKCIIRNAQWAQEMDWLILENAATNSDLLLLRNEGPDAAIILISDSENGSSLIPPRPNYTQLVESNNLAFLADLLFINGTNRTVKITLQNDNDPTPGFSDTLVIQVVPQVVPVPPVITVARTVTNTLTLSWTGGGILQSADSLIPPVFWSNVVGAASPYTVVPAPGTPMRFYRVAMPY